VGANHEPLKSTAVMNGRSNVFPSIVILADPETLAYL